MSCLENLSNITYPNSLVLNLTKLYNFRGKDYYYENVFKNYMDATIKKTIEIDTIYCCKILNFNITEQRIKLLINKDSQPKNKQEIVVKNIRKILEIIQKQGTEIELTDNEFLQMAMKLFEGYEKINYDYTIKDETYNLITEKKKISKRDVMRSYLSKYKTVVKDYIEAIQAAVCLYIDLSNDNVFTSQNDFINLMILYSLIMSNRFYAFKFVSFFKKYYENIKEFKSYQAIASKDWQYGTSKTELFNGFLIEIMIRTYEEVDKLVDDYHFDKNLKKKENVEAVIMKMPKTFTKQDVIDRCPNLSEATVRRALENLHNEGKIESTGTGRSAKWIKIQEDEMFTANALQTNIFDFVSND